MKLLAVDLFCGLGGWTEGFLAEGYDVIGFDIERHDYGTGGYAGQLVLQDILTLTGYQFKPIADRLRVIVASSPSQKYSYMAMPWKRAKALAAWYREDPARQVELNALFNACFRIQREASEACGRHIPLIVENVRGAQPWVGRSAWNFGSYYLWGDVPALMPIPSRSRKVPRFRFDGSGGSFQTASVKATKNSGGSWFNVAHNTTSGKGQNPDGRKVPGQDWSNYAKTGNLKLGGDWFHGYRKGQGPRNHGSNSILRKAASAQMAKIPFPLAQHIARTFKP